LNKEYAKIIDNLYEQSIINFESKQEARKNIHVSDLVGDCARKSWYRLRGYKQAPKDFSKALPLVHGTMLHECVDLEGLEHEVKLAGHIKDMRVIPYTNEERVKEHKFEVVQGAMDDLVEIDDELIICDKKTTKQIPKEVSLQYQTQMNIYKLLYYINKDVDVKKAAIIYIDKTTAWAKHKTIVFDLLDILEIQQFALEKLELLRQEKIPPRVESYLCNWCPFINECNPNVFKR
jgi:CRISPR/Cas system-associated exonuclease Cas4 (RecB family)